LVQQASLLDFDFDFDFDIDIDFDFDFERVSPGSWCSTAVPKSKSMSTPNSGLAALALRYAVGASISRQLS
jgi:hypothetical protein